MEVKCFAFWHLFFVDHSRVFTSERDNPSYRLSGGPHCQMHRPLLLTLGDWLLLKWFKARLRSGKWRVDSWHNFFFNNRNANLLSWGGYQIISGQKGKVHVNHESLVSKSHRSWKSFWFQVERHQIHDLSPSHVTWVHMFAIYLLNPALSSHVPCR